MAQAPNPVWRASLKYSPVNGIIVPWAFDLCCLPKPDCKAPAPTPDPECGGCSMSPAIEPVSTYDWYRWVPEIIAGVENAPADMAASHARRAAIRFAELSRALLRQVVVKLQRGVYRYPLEPFADERVLGVQAVSTPQGPCQCEGCGTGLYLGEVGIDQARQELVVTPSPGACGCHVDGRGPEWLLLTVWARPTEDSCQHDVFLYERFREDITLGARAMLFEEFHGYGSYKTSRGYANARGDALTFQRADRMRQEFERRARKARVEMTTLNAVAASEPRSLFDIGRGMR